MIRLRPAGSRSRRNCSPLCNSTGGVERSTSRTRPGRGAAVGLSLGLANGFFRRGPGERGPVDGDVVLNVSFPSWESILESIWVLVRCPGPDLRMRS